MGPKCQSLLHSSPPVHSPSFAKMLSPGFLPVLEAPGCQYQAIFPLISSCSRMFPSQICNSSFLSSSCLNLTVLETRNSSLAGRPGSATPALLRQPFKAQRRERLQTNRAHADGEGTGTTSSDLMELEKPVNHDQDDSLVPDTLAAMAVDVEFQRVAQQLRDRGQAALTADERKARRRALDQLGVPNFYSFIAKKGLDVPLRRGAVCTLQVNIGLYCNQACAHCHVESSPLRKEMMDRRTVERLVELLKRSPQTHTVDITGGAPELNSNFRYLVREARKLGKEVLDRCNLTVLLEPGQEDLAAFLAEEQVHVVASLPCYSEGNVDKQRGRGVFDRSIRGLLKLNELGYGREGSGLELDLVYNPVGASLPPPQASLEAAYKEELRNNFGVEFNQLFTITNMPIKRFADQLHREGKMQDYMNLLVSSFNKEAVPNVMCTNLVSVRWDGAIFDCDFNQQLAIEVPSAVPKTVFELESLEDLLNVPIACDNHCFGCTAGQGSSCTGAVA